ncbi:MAG: hypothetical protein AABZ74_18755 [Cyanobacteriota bacterium]
MIKKNKLETSPIEEKIESTLESLDKIEEALYREDISDEEKIRLVTLLVENTKTKR